MDKKYQIFLSSTYEDLIEERSYVLDTILKCNCFPAGMELFAAEDSSQWEIIKRVINDSDLYLLIIAGKYGSLTKEGISYTQKEYQYALEKKKPIIAFVVKDLSELKGALLECNDKKRISLESFRKIVLDERYCQFYSNKDELAFHVSTAISNFKKNSKNIDGWIKASRTNLKKISESRNKNLIKQKDSLKLQLEKCKERILKKDTELEKLKLSIKKLPKELGSQPQKIHIALKSEFEKIDKRLNSFYPEKFKSPTLNNKSFEFSSAKMINSLTNLGIPLDVSFEVLNSVADDLLKNRRKVSQLTTDHIRHSVSESLYNLNKVEYSEKTIQSWGDHYYRKYGNPYSRVIIIMGNGEFVNLNYSFIRKTLIIDILKEVVDNFHFKDLLDSIRKDEIERMAREIISMVKSLNVYRLHYKTLLSLAKDMALQPPHPWIVSQAFDFNMVGYDYERTQYHYTKLQDRFNSESYNAKVYSITEFFHHSTSCILATYGVYMGCGYMAPFHNLKYYIEKIIKNKSDSIFKYTSFEKFPNDLTLLGTTLNNFNESLILINSSLEKEQIVIEELVPFINYIWNTLNKILDIYDSENIYH